MALKRLKLSFLISLLMLLIITLSSCGTNEVITILYTTDVHCGVSDKIGYSALQAYKKELEKENKFVSLVDAGDAIQGDYIGAISKGEYIIDIMNEMGYEMMTLGNHEFDYGMDELSKRIDQFKGDILSCNIKYIGKKENKLSKVKPYKILEYGNKKVAYIGITTPHSITTSTPEFFKEDGEFAYSFSSDTKEMFYKTVQDNINECKNKGATTIILLSHLGYGEDQGEFGSIELCKNITGADVILDGHTHKDIYCNYHVTKDGKYIPICDAGYKLNEFGRLTIAPNGSLHLGLITKYDPKDKVMDAYIKTETDKAEESGKQKVATSDIALKTTDDNGIRIVRTRETPLANLIADAYRTLGGADISITNGGGVRADLKEGDLSFKDIMSINPFGNKLTVIKATGQQILDYLEVASRNTQKDYKKDGAALGEFGGFAQVSNLKYTIDTSISSTVEVDSEGVFKEIKGARRVKDVQVLENNQYVALDPAKTYTICSTDYVLLSDGDGNTIFDKCEIVKKDVMLDYEALINYIKDVLKGNIKEKYGSTEGRITII